jgi:hypothetical protein
MFLLFHFLYYDFVLISFLKLRKWFYLFEFLITFFLLFDRDPKSGYHQLDVTRKSAQIEKVGIVSYCGTEIVERKQMKNNGKKQ